MPSTSKQMARPGWASLGDPSQAPQSQNKHNHPPVLPTQFVHLQRPTTLLCPLTCHRSPPSTHTDTGRSPPTAKLPHLILGALHTYRYSHSGLHTPGLGWGLSGSVGMTVSVDQDLGPQYSCFSLPFQEGALPPTSNTRPNQNSVPTPSSAAPRSNGICRSPGYWWLVG